MSNTSEWAVRRKAFHEKQLDRPRRVYRPGRTKILLTRGNIASTVGAAVGAVSLDSPDWLFSVRSRRRVLRRKVLLPGSPDIRAYQFNVEFV